MHMSEYTTAGAALWDLWNYNGLPTTSTPAIPLSIQTSNWTQDGPMSGFDPSGLNLRDRRLNNRIYGPSGASTEDVNHYNNGYPSLILWDSRIVIGCRHYLEGVDAPTTVKFMDSATTVHEYDLDYAARTYSLKDITCIPFATAEDDAHTNLIRYGTEHFVPINEDFWGKQPAEYGVPMLVSDCQGRAVRGWGLHDGESFTGVRNTPSTKADDGVGCEFLAIGSGDSGSPIFLYHAVKGWLFAGFAAAKLGAPGQVQAGSTWYAGITELGGAAGTQIDIADAVSLIELDTTAATFPVPEGMVATHIKAEIAATNAAGTGAAVETPSVQATIEGAYAPYFEDPPITADDSHFDGKAYNGALWQVLVFLEPGSPGITVYNYNFLLDGLPLAGELENETALGSAEGQVLSMLNVLPADSAGKEVSIEVTASNTVGSVYATFSTTIQTYVATALTGLSVSPDPVEEGEDAVLSYTGVGDPPAILTFNYVIDGELTAGGTATIAIPTGTAGSENYWAYLSYHQPGGATGDADVYPFKADIIA